ncbi:MAG: transcription-repair coupling factor [bacterium]|nr:transcription-repair coupling factor [bacterium]
MKAVSLTSLIEQPGSNRAVPVSGLTLPGAALLASRLASSRPLAIITPSAESAQAFTRDLSLFMGKAGPCTLPPSESLPYEQLTPDVDTAAARIAALASLRSGERTVVIPAEALSQPVPPPGALDRWVLTVREGASVDRDELTGRLAAMGYRREPVALHVGDVAVRGGIVDIFSPLSEKPMRIELWGEDIQSIRFFDPETQRSAGPAHDRSIFPVTEFLLGPEELKEAADRLSRQMAAAGVRAAERERTLSLFVERSGFPGASLYLPLAYGEAFYPLDHLHGETLIFLYEPREIRASLDRFSSLALKRHSPPFPEPGLVYQDPDRTYSEVTARPGISVSMFDLPGARSISCLPPLPDNLPASRPDRMVELIRLLEDKGGEDTVVLCIRSSSAAERLGSVIAEAGHLTRLAQGFPEAVRTPGTSLVIGTLSGGFHLPGEKLTIISDADIFGPARATRPSTVTFPEWELPIGSLIPGDVVVHIDHGIGRYEGLRQLEVAKTVDDFLQITYADGNSLYVPVWHMNRVQRYRSSSETPPPLSRLGSVSWNRSKDRIRRSLKLMADELLKVSAAREGQVGHPFRQPDSLFREFEASFPWAETPDQERSIAEVISDMTSPTPMDRLVCGDVGFGKTEVALRAAFLAAADGKQTALLVPTTVLAQQHFQTFSQRLKDFPVTVGLLSRFVTPARQKEVVESLAAGELDIVIGTHRLLSKDISFADLGLIIIDEEHRFGVRHKEKLKKFRQSVDILTLSATPIPRTLFQAFSGLRSLSLIHTPPADRKSVHTEVRYFDEDVIADAITKELDRGGQVYLVHNRIETIGAMRDMVRKLVPHARVGLAHGQMSERELEEVMVRFLDHEYDVLVTTAIIESGLDITNANTLIVNRADRFGLAQLYQLRGRVGRSPVRAYSHFFVPSENAIGSKAKQRLRSLRELTELGSGFRLASYDLEMRGAGNLLGEEQSGRVDAVGLELYSQLLEQAVREAAGQETLLQVQPNVTLPLPAYLPEDYLPEVGERLTLYKRLAGTPDLAALESLREETADRFGRFPPEVSGLFTRMEVEITARSMAIERIDSAGPYIIVVFHPEARISPDALVRMLSLDKRLTFAPPTTLKLDVSGFPSASDRITFMMDILRSL